MKQKFALVSDFDGTITDTDFFDLVVDNLLDKDAITPWQEHLAGKKSHLEALNEIFSKIHLTEDKLEVFIDKINWDKSFLKVAELCRIRQIPISICSAGCDYYINRLIGPELAKYNIKLVTNKGVYSPTSGLKMLPPPPESPYYDKNIGISKSAIVQELQNNGCFVIYAGDGHPDFPAAKISDAVFAKSKLLKICQTEGIKTHRFNSFEDVYNFVKGL